MDIPSVVSVEQTGPYRLRLRFDDGVEGEIDIRSTTTFDGVFEPRNDPEYLSRVRVDADAGTIVWPNGADLHSKITGIPVALDSPKRMTG